MPPYGAGRRCGKVAALGADLDPANAPPLASRIETFHDIDSNEYKARGGD